MKHIRLIIILAAILVVLAIPPLVFIGRQPVLIITDAPFAALYGEENLKQRQASASAALFRPVKPVPVADGASSDMVIFAIAEASSRPFCVLFSRAHAMAARQFHEQFPEIPAVLFAGVLPVAGLPEPDGVLCVYRTDRETDLYRAGLFAGILGMVEPKPAENPEESGEKPKKDEKEAEKPEKPPKQEEPKRRTYALWQDRQVQKVGQEIFTRGLREQDPEAVVVFANNANGMPDINTTSCIVLTRAGAEYLEKNPKMPVILFSWVDPDLTAQEIAVQFDDSAWALAVPAVRMATEKQAEGLIPSTPLIFSGKIADNSVSRTLKKSVKKVPEGM